MEEETSAHPHRMPDSHHRKVELQSPHDLTYLQANLVASAKEKLDLHFPRLAAQQTGVTSVQPATVISLDGVGTDANNGRAAASVDAAESNREQQPEWEDPLRARVRQLVDAFMSRTWEGASQNITVNGMDATSFPIVTSTTTTKTQQGEPQEGIDFVYEAYDTRLQAKVAGLYGELEALTAQVSRLRRLAPKQGAEEYRNTLMAQLAEEEEAFQANMSELREKGTSVPGAKLQLKPMREGWHEDVKAMYERASDELIALAGLAGSKPNSGSGLSPYGGASLTETVGKVQRARNVAMEFE